MTQALPRARHQHRQQLSQGPPRHGQCGRASDGGLFISESKKIRNTRPDGEEGVAGEDTEPGTSEERDKALNMQTHKVNGLPLPENTPNKKDVQASLEKVPGSSLPTLENHFLHPFGQQRFPECPWVWDSARCPKGHEGGLAQCLRTWTGGNAGG